MEIAYKIYPLPDGRIYTENDVQTIDDVIKLFDDCQIMDAMISKQGWAYLIEKFGVQRLYQADKESGWFDCDSMEEFSSMIDYEKSIAYSYEDEHGAVTDFLESTHFSAP